MITEQIHAYPLLSARKQKIPVDHALGLSDRSGQYPRLCDRVTPDTSRRRNRGSADGGRRPALAVPAWTLPPGWAADRPQRGVPRTTSPTARRDVNAEESGAVIIAAGEMRDAVSVRTNTLGVLDATRRASSPNGPSRLRGGSDPAPRFGPVQAEETTLSLRTISPVRLPGKRADGFLLNQEHPRACGALAGSIAEQPDGVCRRRPASASCHPSHRSGDTRKIDDAPVPRTSCRSVQEPLPQGTRADQ
jgi:hypothetical protein